MIKEDIKNCSNNNYSYLLKSLCNILKERKNKESSYATFFQTESVVVDLNEFFPFNTINSYKDDIILLNSTDIQVEKSGVYHIIYKIPVTIENKKEPIEQSLSLYINGILQKNIQRTFGVVDSSDKKRMSIIGDIIVYIQDDTILQLKNDGFPNSSKPICTCNKEGNVATFNIVKIG